MTYARICEVRPRKDRRGVDLISRCAPIRSTLVRRAKRNHERSRLREIRSRSHDAVIRVYDQAGNVIETHEHAGTFKE
ncbi:MAG: hypothetical protein DME71_10065 [Verrucomicrobia bacterium]|nr:MAG: hypothetical protein DME71_10065 [Verrucomicrobiota bacterium]